MNKESHSLRSLQDFFWNVGVPPILKRDNDMTQTGKKWTVCERQMCINRLITQPHSPWKNASKHAINNLLVMQIKMKEFDVPLNQHHWCVEWCKDVCKTLSMRKLGQMTPKEVLIGVVPDVSMFKFHVWEDMCYLDPDAKQPKHDMLPGKFLGITWTNGDSLCCFVRKPPTDKSK